MTPETETELAQIVAGLSGPVSIVGGGTRGVAGSAPALDISRLTGIHLYEPGALTLVAAAGTPLAEVEAALDAEGQRLAFEPMDHRVLLGTSGAPTIGGVVAANVSGPRRVQAGACRDFLLGVRFVDGGGAVIKNGGRVMKNVTGYDLVKLMAGSWGTLGVLSEVSLKVLPKPEATQTLAIAVPDAERAVGPDAERAVGAMSDALGSPFEVSGAAYDPERGQVFARLEGFADSVAYRSARLSERLARWGDITRPEAPDLWSDIRDVRCFADRAGDVWRISCRPSDAPDLAQKAGADALLFDWGGDLIWALMAEGSDLRARLGGFDGHATLIRSDQETRAQLGMFHPQPAPLAAIQQALRTRFDPQGRFNPGLMG
ncbi:FAD-binding protein [Ruegeria jejuensis]|uniref:FAD-binding protein n=1 Tax=Ruegeria jejuensis TaxID=3233338 RepID=UPI00355C0853